MHTKETVLTCALLHPCEEDP